MEHKIETRNLHSMFLTKLIVLCVLLSVTAPRIFSRIFLNKHKLHNLIKRKFYILIITTIKKTRKYIKFTIAFYEFSYFETVI